MNVDKNKIRREKYALNKDKYNEWRRNYSKKNKEKINKAKREYYHNNKKLKPKHLLSEEEILAKQNQRKQKKKERDKAWRQKNIERLREYDHNRRARCVKRKRIRLDTEPEFKLIMNTRSLIRRKHEQNGFKKTSKAAKILGCDWETYKLHIESQFEPWMNWDNMGKYVKNGPRTWGIDHIIPISKGRTTEEKIMLMHYLNCRPLCSYQNIVDGDRRYVSDQQLNDMLETIIKRGGNYGEEE